MNRKKISCIVLMLLGMGITGLYAQQSTNASGGNATGSGGSLSYSVGQVANSYISGSGSLSQGVQQPYEISTGIDEDKNISLSMNVFPNPASSTVTLKVENNDLKNLWLQLYTVTGQLVQNQKISTPLTQVPMQGLPVGSYVLKVSDKQSVVKSFTIIKNN